MELVSSIYKVASSSGPDWRAARYQKVLRATIAVMQAHGSDDLSMDEIARSARVGKATLYRYFDTKEGLLRACLAGVVHDLGTRMERAEAAPLPAPQRLHEIIRIMVEGFSRHLLPARLLARGSRELDEAWRGAVQEARARLVAVLERHFRLGARQGHYRGLDAKLVPHLIMGMIRSGVTHTGLSNAAVADGIYDFVLRGTSHARDGRRSLRG